MLPSAKKDCVLTTQKSCVVYEFSCRCEARYVGCTSQKLANRIKEDVPKSIRKKSNTVREQPPCICKNNNSKINCESAIRQQLFTNSECAKIYTDDIFRIIGQARPSLHSSVLESIYIKTQNPVFCRQKSSFSHMDSSSKQWWIGPNWPLLGPIRLVLSCVSWQYMSVHLSVAIRRFTLRQVSGEKAFKYI